MGEEMSAEEFEKQAVLSAIIGTPIENLIKTENCMKCGKLSMEYGDTHFVDGHYWVLKKCKNHDERVDYIIPLDEYMGKIMIKYDNGEIYFK